MANPIIAIRDYFQHSIVELKKVSWPSKEMTVRYSILVVVISLATAAFFAALDFGLQTGVNAALTNKQVTSEPPAAPVMPTVEPTGVDANGGVTVTPTPTETPTPNESAPITLPPISAPQN